MSLKWENYWEIAEALNDAYTDIDLSSLDDDTLLKMITELPGFEDTPAPAGKYDLDAVMTSWINLAYPEESDTVPSTEI